jgi:hypothetical protein
MEEEAARVNDIISTLIVMSRGNFVIDAGRELFELTEAIKDTGKKGKLVITLEVTPSGLRKGVVNQCEIRPDVTIQKPKPDQGKSIFFITDDNHLVREDPAQMEMELETERETNGHR